MLAGDTAVLIMYRLKVFSIRVARDIGYLLIALYEDRSSSSIGA